MVSRDLFPLGHCDFGNPAFESGDQGVQPSQELKTLLLSVRSMGRRQQFFDLSDTPAGEQRWPEGQAVVQCNGVDSVTDHGSQPYEADDVGQTFLDGVPSEPFDSAVVPG